MRLGTGCALAKLDTAWKCPSLFKVRIDAHQEKSECELTIKSWVAPQAFYLSPPGLSQGLMGFSVCESGLPSFVVFQRNQTHGETPSLCG